MKDKPVVLIDNYDSFTFNIYQSILEITPHVQVFRNDKVTVEEIVRLKPRYIVISPGPGEPKNAGISRAVIAELGGTVKTLGVCLGHQCINEVFGGRTVRAPRVCHGKTSIIMHDRRTLFRGLPPRIEVARYHSLIVDRPLLCEDLEISAWTSEGIVMGIRHRYYPIEGVQFHPESFLTVHGKKMIENFFRE